MKQEINKFDVRIGQKHANPYCCYKYDDNSNDDGG